MSQEEIEYEVMDVEDVRFLKERVRELEAEKEGMEKQYWQAVEGWKQRIAKAKAILDDGWNDNNLLAMKEALEALEGK